MPAISSRKRQWHPTPVLLPGKSHGWRSLIGCSPWGHEESDTTEWLHFHFSLSCIGEGNGNPLQCSCLENPRDGGTWWAAISGVAQSQTWLKRLSSSSTKVSNIQKNPSWSTNRRKNMIVPECWEEKIICYEKREYGATHCAGVINFCLTCLAWVPLLHP